MADNINVTPGTGGTAVPVKTDEVGSAHYQVVKLDGGGDGVSVPVVAGQQAMAASLPVVIASNQSAVPVSAASLPLPSGAATAALQGGGLPAALGAQGALKVEGVAGGTVIPVSDGGGAITVDGTVTATVASTDDVITITCSLDTNIYATGDVLFDTQEIAGAVVANGGKAILHTITILDEDDQGAPIDLVFLNANNSLGTENSAANISDANARTVLGCVQVVASDYVDLGGCKVATLRNVGLLLEAGAAATSLYVGGIVRSAPTFTAAGLQIMFGLMGRS